MFRSRRLVALLLPPLLALIVAAFACTPLSAGTDSVPLVGGDGSTPTADASGLPDGAASATDAGMSHADAADLGMPHADAADAEMRDAGPADAARPDDAAASDPWVTTGSSFIEQNYVPMGGIFLPGIYDDPIASGGRDEVAYVFEDDAGSVSIDVHSWDGSRFVRSRRATDVDMWHAAGGPQWIAGDLDGDGHTDIVQAWSQDGLNTFDVLLWTDGSFVLTPEWISDSYDGNIGGSGIFVAGHFLGNCTTDLAYVHQDGWPPVVAFDVYRSTGSGFSLQSKVDCTAPYPSPLDPAQRGGKPMAWGWTPTAQWLVADFNGDGRDDLVVPWEGTNIIGQPSQPPLQTNVDAYYAAPSDAGVTFNYAQIFQGTGADSWNWFAWWMAGDANGDGRADLFYAYGDANGNLALDEYVSKSSSTNPFVLTALSATPVVPFYDQGQFFAGHFTHPNVASGGHGTLADVVIAYPTSAGQIAFDVRANTGTAAPLCGPASCGLGPPDGGVCN